VFQVETEKDVALRVAKIAQGQSLVPQCLIIMYATVEGVKTIRQCLTGKEGACRRRTCIVLTGTVAPEGTRRTGQD